jgi:hypothetical protein
MKNKKYNFWKALLYEIVSSVIDQYVHFKKNYCFLHVLKTAKKDWIMWRLERFFIQKR